MLKIVSRGLSTNRFYVLIPAQYITEWKKFERSTQTEARTESSELNWMDTVRSLADFSGLPAESAGQQAEPAGAMATSAEKTSQTAYKETSKETTQETTQERSKGRGSLRSPQVVSLRSSTHANSFTEDQKFSKNLDFTEDQEFFPTDDFTPKNGFAATALRFEPVTVVAVVDDTQEEHMSDEELEARKASVARAALIGAQRFDAAKAAKEAKQRAKAKQEASSGTPALPKLKVPKQTLFGKLHDLQQTWMLEFQQKFPNDSMEKSWGPKEGGMLKRLLERWGHEDLERAMRYYIRYWERQRARYPKIKATLPTLGLFTSLDASVVPEAKKMFTALKVKTEYDQWCDANPSATRAPKELQAAYDAVREDLKAMGM
jgi:hypothetical protein